MLPQNQGVLTDAEFAAIKETKQELAKKTAAQLKDMLATNELPKSGTKPDLLDMVAENKVLGVLPKCSVCQKGRMKWNRADGKKTCSGHFDDALARFVRCKGPSDEEKEKIMRTPWKTNDDNLI